MMMIVTMMNFHSILALFLATWLAVGGWAHEIDVKSKGMFKMHIRHIYTQTPPPHFAIRGPCIRDGNRNEMVTGFSFLIYGGISVGIQCRWKSRV